MPVQARPQPAESTTDRVREFYELFPYPSNAMPALRSGFDFRFVSSRAQQARPAGKRVEVLDAGCGRGVGLVANAALNPGAQYLGVDLCQSSLNDTSTSAAQRGLSNVDFQVADLMSLEGVPIPDGGFDLIYSSGVIHHLEDPVAGLRKLGEVLAPHGVIVFMVYGTIGRRRINRVRKALAGWLDSSATLIDQLPLARAFVETLAKSDREECPFADAASCADAEFVDRYLHPQETDFDVPGLFDLIEKAGLRFLEWQGNSHCLDGVLEAGPLRDSIEALPERDRFTVIEQLVRPENHQLLLCKPGNGARRLPPLNQWDQLLFAANPEVCFHCGQRNLWGQGRTESIGYSLDGGEAIPIEEPFLQQAALLVATQTEAFRGAAIIQALTEAGLNPDQAHQALQGIFDLGLVYAPHEVELSS